MGVILGIESTAHTFSFGGVYTNGETIPSSSALFRPEQGGIHPREAADHHSLLSGNLFKEFISKNQIRKLLDIQPKFGAQDEAGKRLSDIVECHVKKYFDGHGGLLPPKGVYQRIIKELETPIIEVSLRACKGNQLKCAELLGINRNTLRKKVKNINIDVAKYKKLM